MPSGDYLLRFCVPILFSSRNVLEEVLIYEAAELFGGYLERMQLRRCLANPSPLSAELVEIDPSIKDMVEHLEVEFGIKLSTK